jgi:hypothetical protein
MQRLLLLILLLAPACARREVATGEWTGVARPDATVPQGGPVLDNSGGATKGAVDAAASVPDASTAGGGEFAPADAASGPRTAEAAPPPAEPVSAPPDASTDSGDATSCPDTGRCD